MADDWPDVELETFTCDTCGKVGAYWRYDTRDGLPAVIIDINHTPDCNERFDD